MNKPASVLWSEIRQQLIDEDPELAAAVEDLAPEYEIARQLIKARIDSGKVSTHQSTSNLIMV
ncbi:MAG: hypothetical protein ACYC27_22230 [Armatimonadota bacterium]